ncbi:MAG: isoaspartyl peptidase/L-asparaginase [Desulfurococcales archaeon]|nr:isoaspartyl peptidase/L-asparaginase [Desulfurococcales archaeon]
MPARPLVLVHGGAGRWSLVFEAAREAGVEITEERVMRAVEAAAHRGLKTLLSTGDPVSAVVEAVAYMEDSGLFNAGVGSSLDASGGLSMDAGVMRDTPLAAGGVACVRIPRNPVRLARYVMEETGHVIMCGEPADRLAARIGLPPHPGPSPRAKALHRLLVGKARKWEEGFEYYRQALNRAEKLGFLTGDTVGAVAVAPDGRTAAAVSTGGTALKLPGRVGDSPLPGAGYYALPNAGAAAATGRGESIMLAQLTGTAVSLLREGLRPGDAAWEALSRMRRLTGERGGLILVSKGGEYAAAFNTEAMPWAVATPERSGSGLWGR